MDDIDAGTYLTERLRKAHPEPFEQELERRKHTSHWRGFAFGVMLSGAVAVVVAVALFTFFPGLVEDLIAQADSWR